MNKLKILHFKNNKKAYAHGNIFIKLNKEDPTKIEEVSTNKNQLDEFFRNPQNLDVSISRGNLKIKRIKKIK